VIRELLDNLMLVVRKAIQFHRVSRAKFLEFQQETQQSLHNIEDAIIRLTGKPYVDKFLDDDVSCIRLGRNRIYDSLNRQPVYEENIIYGEKDVEAINLVGKVELLSNKQYVQPLSLAPTIALVEHPLQVQLITNF
jgi:hypothetical protein